MKKTSYQVTTAEGKIETRKSNRPYVAVLLGRADYVAMRARERRDQEVHESNFKYYQKVAARSIDSPAWSQYDPTSERERDIKNSQEQIAGHTMESYKAAKVAAYIARYCPEGKDQGPEVALRWSASVANAQGAISEFQARYYTAFRVVAAEVATTTNRAGATPGNKESNMNAAATTTKKKTTKKATTTKQASKKVAPKTAKKVATKKALKATAAAAPATQTRKGTIVALISRKGGATLGEIMKAIDWQAHSVRGTIATLGKTLKIESTKNANGERTYSAQEAR